MKNTITLLELLKEGNTITGLYWDSNEFLKKLDSVLVQDPIRNNWLSRGVAKDWINFSINKDWPINDFYEALRLYFISLDFNWTFPSMDEVSGRVFDILNP